MIKKILLTNFLLFCVIFSSVAQKFELGLKGGGNFATQKLNTIQGIESVTGFHLGGFVYFKLPILFGIQAEAYYSQQGSQFSVNQIIKTNNLDYINIPVLIRNDFGPFNFHFGPQFGILTDASVSFNNVKNNIKNQYLWFLNFLMKLKYKQQMLLEYAQKLLLKQKSPYLYVFLPSHSKRNVRLRQTKQL